jgi:hypothetical protein
MEPKEAKENLNELYVDHLTAGLEKRPLGKILDFMALYCGWEEIFTYVFKKVEEKRLAQDDELNELLSFIKRFGGIYTYPAGDENQKKVFAGCLELEKRGLVCRSDDVPDVVFFKARPVSGVNVVVSKALEPGQFVMASQSDIDKAVDASLRRSLRDK